MIRAYIIRAFGFIADLRQMETCIEESKYFSASISGGDENQVNNGQSLNKQNSITKLQLQINHEAKLDSLTNVLLVEFFQCNLSNLTFYLRQFEAIILGPNASIKSKNLLHIKF
mmetsp:Transcript_10138/g.11511  ORF Transcript_10138/g.11511 Transcript_10138/m.11511 type:complete len:114 (-) Transcript_10138:40-381(-)